MFRSAVFALVLTFLAVPAYAQPGEGHPPGGPSGHAEQGQGPARWSQQERGQVREYYRAAPRQEAAPAPAPKVRKQIARGKPLPPGLQWRVDEDLMRRMPPRPGYEYRVVGTDVLLVEIASGVIADLLRGAARPR